MDKYLKPPFAKPPFRLSQIAQRAEPYRQNHQHALDLCARKLRLISASCNCDWHQGPQKLRDVGDRALQSHIVLSGCDRALATAIFRAAISEPKRGSTSDLALVPQFRCTKRYSLDSVVT